ncbi:hypothetical protein CVT25_003877 [Psilocybe cyanescens]|uniref:Uncharacterized protein n=1 Tax=Psilocybe cyanescens TaxID=93625 RepID=A0A409XPU4_PSICY|nr:hypothetical protein CVT25_003877 [Psilocybe cyanescens]
MAEKRKSDKVYPIFAKRTKPNTQDEDPNNIIDSATSDKLLLQFQQLLDFSSVEREDEISARLDRIARALLHEFRLVVKPPSRTTKAGNPGPQLEDLEFQILEAEFYLRLEGCHEDPFTHGSEEQKVSGHWYFHRAAKFSKDSHRSLTSTTEYRDGSRKGMDLTFGGPLPAVGSNSSSSSSNDTGSTSVQAPLRLGGILLRTIREVKSKKIISGPSLLVDRILAASGAPGIRELVHDQDKWAGNISAFKFFSTAGSNSDSGSSTQTTSLYLKPIKTRNDSDEASNDTIYFSPRIGLELSHPGITSATTLPLHPRIRFLPKRYRFFSRPHLLTVNGRPQTFLGVLQSCIASDPNGLQKPGLSRDIARLTGIKESTAAKYLADYMSGRDAGAELLNSVIGPQGKGASSSPATYLKMMGAISALDL